MLHGVDRFGIRVSWKSEKKTVIEEKFMPSVIEPSFGIGRVLYSLMEHAFYQRKSDEQVTRPPGCGTSGYGSVAYCLWPWSTYRRACRPLL